ncbi:hypothetical protein [Calothrix sp. 336/3]|uniref:hypothetical protein n=1 Tax=Calothrix sp. 336/3 TaxID=1337936 RepID=UPI000ADA6E19|nr:hypothetical protein [Calothrix sp. 336/3]
MHQPYVYYRFCEFVFGNLPVLGCQTGKIGLGGDRLQDGKGERSKSLYTFF